MKLSITKGGIIGAIILPLFYIILLIITNDPDSLVNKLGLIGLPLWIVQWIAFLLGGWTLAIIASVLFLAGFGYIFGLLINLLINKIKHKK